MSASILSTIYYLSAVGLVLFSLLLYLLKRLFGLDFWVAWERPVVSSLIVVSGSTWWLVNLALAIYLSMQNPVDMFFVGYVWRGVALLFVLVGLAIGLWAMKTFRTMKKLYGKIDSLVTQGPYRYTRNPQYLSLMLITIGAAIFFNSLHLLLFAATIAASAYFAALMEEEELEKLFGQQYAKYRKETPRLIPFTKPRR
jgi:protein-S-isoprenylcysteine O-methyltransferase Ste14